MICVEKIETFNWRAAVRGMRNPLNSWDRSDSTYSNDAHYYLGKNDLELMHKLYSAGPEHRKYMRQIQVSMDITAPLYWWKEFDTYKIGTVANSCSTMHKIMDKEFTKEDFSFDNMNGNVEDISYTMGVVNYLNKQRKIYLDTKSKITWRKVIETLPSSYNQKRTVTMNYENVVNIIHQRTGHKLYEWNEFVNVLWQLPYLKDIVGNSAS